MFVSKDALWKGIIESLIDDFIRFFFAEHVSLIDFEKGFVFLDTELQKLLPDSPSQQRHADKLIKAWLKTGEEVWFLIHVEVQGYPDPYFDRRMYQSVYRIEDKFQQPVTGLAIYTDWEHKYHYKAYYTSFLGSNLTYNFNTYVLCEHPITELSQIDNPFAAVMEAAWQYLNKPADDHSLRVLKLELIQRLKNRNISRDKILIIINFIKFFVPFTNSEIRDNFEQDLITINKESAPMGLIEAILEDVKKQGIEQGIERGIEQGIERGIEQGIEQGIEIGEAKREESLLRQAVPALLNEGFSAEKIALVLNVELDKVLEVLDHLT